MIDDGILIVQSFVRSFDIFQGYTNQQPSSFFKYFQEESAMDGCPNTCVVDTKLNIHVMQENLRQNYIEFLANIANNKTQSMF